MSQRDSGYARRDRDDYSTPEWVTMALVPHLPPGQRGVWEPAAGRGKMADTLRKAGFEVSATDIETGDDFLKANQLCNSHIRAIVTNPPYALAEDFIEHALRLTKPVNGTVAMLLRTDFDHAKTRQQLFGQCRCFWTKLVLTKRIRWFEDSKGSPSFNHSWFLWDWQHRGLPTLAYGP
jgi:hypothetical protein